MDPSATRVSLTTRNERKLRRHRGIRRRRTFGVVQLAGSRAATALAGWIVGEFALPFLAGILTSFLL